MQLFIIVLEEAMKRRRLVAFTFGLLVLMSGAALAGEEEMIALSLDREATVSRILSRMQSCSAQEMRSLACILGEGKVSEAVIPLLTMLHNGNEDCRIAAALALARIGDARGTFAVKQSARLDESPRVRLVSAWFYETYVQPGTFAFVTTDRTAPALAQDR
jgi:HEAT repeat protein